MTTNWLFWLGGGLLGLAGLWLCYWSLLADRAKGRKRCPKCWYNMQAAENLRCPECGKTVKTQRKLLKTRRRWRWAFVSIMLLLSSFSLAVTPIVRKNGWTQYVPSTVWIMLIGRTDSTFPIDELSRRITDFHSQYTGSNVYFTKITSRESLYGWQWTMLRKRLVATVQVSSSDKLRIRSLYVLKYLDLIEADDAAIYVGCLEDPNTDINAAAYQLFAHKQLKETLNNPDTFQIVVTAAEDPNYQVYISALLTLPYASDWVDEVIEILNKSLESDDPIRSTRACNAFGKMKNQADIVFPILLEKLNDPNYPHLYEAFYSIVDLGMPKEDLVPLLCNALQSQNNNRVDDIAFSLGEIADVASDAIVPLSEHLGIDDEQTYDSVSFALSDIVNTVDLEDSFPHCLQALHSEIAEAREWAAEVVTRFPSKSDILLPVLEELLGDESPLVVINAAQSIAKFRNDTKFLLPILIALLTHENPVVRTRAADGIRGVGALAVEAIPALKVAAKDEDPDVRDAAEYTLEVIEWRIRESKLP